MSDRITHLDTVRGGAVMGILVMNAVAFGIGDVAYFDISLGTEAPRDLAAAVLGEVLADQKFMGLFSLLFGASVLLFWERAAGRGRRAGALSLWRNALLLFIGLAHSALWVGDILVVYALCAPALLALRRLPWPLLLCAGAAVFGVAPLVDHALGQAPEAVVTAVLSGTVEGEAAEWVGLGILVQVFSRALGMMLVGMGLYRSGRLQRLPEGRGLLGKSAALTVAGGALAGLGVWRTLGLGPGSAGALGGNVLNSLATLPMTLGYLGLLSWWDRHGHQARVARVRALGRMALTHYLSQTVLGLALVAALPAAWVSRSTLWVGILAIWALQLAASKPLLDRWRFGPLEWAWRCATYRRWEPLRRRPTHGDTGGA